MMKKEGEAYKYATFHYASGPTKIPYKIVRSKHLDTLLGKKIVDAFHCDVEDDYYGTYLVLEDGTELEINPDGEYGTCVLRIDGDEPQ